MLLVRLNLKPFVRAMLGEESVFYAAQYMILPLQKWTKICLKRVSARVNVIYYLKIPITATYFLQIIFQAIMMKWFRL